MPRWPSLHLRLPPRTPGCTGSRHAPLRKPHGDTRVGALERGYRVAAGPRRVPCRGRRLVESRSLSLTGPCRDVRCIAASFLKCRGWPSRQAPLAGALSLHLECFVLEWLQRNPRRTLAVVRQALPRGAATARAQVWDTRVPLL